MQHIARKAFAKINLGLLITARRPDGYHTLETVFAPINWYDELSFSPAQDLFMQCSNRELPVDDSNLCIRAARALREHAGIARGASIELVKHIPFGAGLGGGSSDAAATLGALNRLWGLDLPREELHDIAVGLGADVPYFLGDGALSYATGIGEQLEELGFSLPFNIVTVFPGEHISTVWAYRNFYARFDREVPDLKALLGVLCDGGDRSVLEAFENDFEPAVFDHFPAVRQARDELLDAGSFFASLSGSGSAVFGLFDSEEAASAALGRLSGTYPATLTPAGFSMNA